MDSDLQSTGQSYFLDENLQWSHGHYGHFAPGGLTGNPARSSVFDKSVETHFSKSMGVSFGIYIRYFDAIPAANSMKIWSELD